MVKVQQPNLTSNNGTTSNGDSAATESTTNAPPAGTGDTVDLTLSDSDDDMPLKKVPCTRSTTQQNNSKPKTNGMLR